mgnify:CR=1 FL=1
MVHDLYEKLIAEGYNFFTGVPDSALKPFQNAIIQNHAEDHIIATNEGQAIGIAVGADTLYHNTKLWVKLMRIC